MKFSYNDFPFFRIVYIICFYARNTPVRTRTDFEVSMTISLRKQAKTRNNQNNSQPSGYKKSACNFHLQFALRECNNF